MNILDDFMMLIGFILGFALAPFILVALIYIWSGFGALETWIDKKLGNIS